MKRDNGNYEADFQWLNNEIEVEVFHDKYYSAETLSIFYNFFWRLDSYYK